MHKLPSTSVKDPLEATKAHPTPSHHGVNRPTRRRLKIGGVEERLGVHRQTIWRWYTAGLFPPPHYLGSERLWYEDIIEAWEHKQMLKRAAEKAQPP